MNLHVSDVLFGSACSSRDLRKQDENVRLSGSHFSETFPSTACKERPYRRCRLCLIRGLRRETRQFCNVCPSKPALCKSGCFEDYHTLQVLN